MSFRVNAHGSRPSPGGKEGLSQNIKDNREGVLTLHAKSCPTNPQTAPRSSTPDLVLLCSEQRVEPNCSFSPDSKRMLLTLWGDRCQCLETFSILTGCTCQGEVIKAQGRPCAHSKDKLNTTMPRHNGCMCI